MNFSFRKAFRVSDYRKSRKDMNALWGSIEYWIEIILGYMKSATKGCHISGYLKCHLIQFLCLLIQRVRFGSEQLTSLVFSGLFAFLKMDISNLGILRPMYKNVRIYQIPTIWNPDLKYSSYYLLHLFFFPIEEHNGDDDDQEHEHEAHQTDHDADTDLQRK